MESKTVRNIIIGVILGLIFAAGLFGAGFAVGRSLPAFDLGTDLGLPRIGPLGEGQAETPSVPTGTVAPETREELFEPFWEAWKIVHENYVAEVNDVDLMRGAIRGMLNSLGDPHTGYMTPEEYQQANIPLQGEYEGIGAWVDPSGEFLTIISPMPDSPAMEAGLKSGDQVIAVDGEDMTGVEGNQVIRRILGPAGTEVELTIRREGRPEPFTVEVTRQEITVPTVESRMLEDDIGYLRLFNFGEDTTRDLRRHLRDLMKQNPRGMILDLRGNGGGFLGTAVNVASEFIGEGVVLVERFGDGSEKEYRASGDGLATEIPLVVLIDGGSASASEIVAGAIQDHDRGVLVGEMSFGKGSVQNWIPLSDEAGAVRVTVARWHTPDGRQISQEGLTPGVEVEMTEEDLQSDEDPQLDRAIEVLKEEID